MQRDRTCESLQSDVFTLKMRIHHYEERLKLVNMHGLNGETLFSRNQELEELLEATTDKLKMTEDEVEYVKDLLEKTKLAIETYNDRVLELNAALKERTENADALRERCQEIQALFDKSEAEQTAALERCDTLEIEVNRLAPFEDLARKLPEVTRKRDALEARVEELQKELKEANLMIQEARNDAAKAATRAELAAADLESAQKEFKRETARRTEEFEQKHAATQRRFEAIFKENELQMNIYEERINSQEFEIKKYATRAEEAKHRERDLNDENSRLKVELKNARRSEELNTDRLRRELEDLRQQDADEAQNAFLKMQTELTNRLHEKRRELERTCKDMAAQKEKYRRAAAEQAAKLDETQEELERIKLKWKNSMSNKRLLHKENSVANSTAATRGTAGARKSSPSVAPKSASAGARRPSPAGARRPSPPVTRRPLVEKRLKSRNAAAPCRSQTISSRQGNAAAKKTPAGAMPFR